MDPPRIHIYVERNNNMPVHRYVAFVLLLNIVYLYDTYGYYLWVERVETFYWKIPREQWKQPTAVIKLEVS